MPSSKSLNSMEESSNSYPKSVLEGQDFERYEKFTRNVVSHTMRTFRLPKEIKEECLSAAFEGLVEAAERFDPSSGSTFEAFSYMRIRGSILDYLRKEYVHSGIHYRQLQKLKSIHDLESNLNSSISKDGSDSEALAKILSFAQQTTLAIRFRSVEEKELQHIACNSKTPEQALTEKSSLHFLAKQVALLADKEKFIIEQHYFHGKSFSEIIALRPELSKSWVSRLHARALERLAIILRDSKEEQCTLC